MSPKTRFIASVASITFLTLSFAASPVVIRNQSMDFAVNHALAMGGGGGGGGGGDGHGGGGHGDGGAGAGPDSGWRGTSQGMGTQQGSKSSGNMPQYSPEPMMSRETVRSVQHSLNQLGFQAGPEDGKMGPQTRRAISSYQAQMGMPPDGVMTPDLANRIMAGAATLNTRTGQRMGPGYGMGQGMGPGYGMGQGMGPGMMAPLREDLSAADVRHMMEHRLAWQGNPNIKVGNVEEKDDDTIVADIVTQDGSLVQKFEVDRHTGWTQPAN